MALLIQGESVVMFWGNYGTLWWAVLGLSVLSVLFVRVGLAHFQREELLGREIDVLNIRWGWRTFISEFKGEAKSIWQWYKIVIPGTIKGLRWSLLISLVLIIVGVWLGTLQVNTFNVSLEASGLGNLNANLSSMAQMWPVGALGPVVAVFWQNLRVLLLGMVAGLLSFGILGVIPLLASVAVAGYLMALLQANGMAIGVYLIGFILPHGIIEIPAVMLATAAVMQAGVILATPNHDQTIGEVWIRSIANWAKIMVGVVIPMLVLSSMIEVWVTPRLALYLFFS